MGEEEGALRWAFTVMGNRTRCPQLDSGHSHVGSVSRPVGRRAGGAAGRQDISRQRQEKHRKAIHCINLSDTVALVP